MTTKTKKSTVAKKDSYQLKKSELLQMHSESTDKGKATLEKLYGKTLFHPPKPEDKIKSLADVLRITKPDKETMAFINYKGKNRKIIGAKNFVLAELIAEAYNEGWVPDWTNSNEYKWFPYFDGRKGFGFSLSNYAIWHSYSHAGSRLAFKSEALSNHAGKLFVAVYQELINK